MRTTALAVALLVGLSGLYLSTPGTIFNWDNLFLAEHLRTGDWGPLLTPYRPLSIVPSLAWWSVLEGLGLELDPLAAQQVLGALLSAATIAGFFVLLHRETGSTPAALLASLGVAVSMGFWFQATHPKWYGFTSLCLVGSLLALQRWSRKPASRARTALLGSLVGLAALVHGTLAALAGALVVVVERRLRWRHGLFFLAVAALMAALGVAACLTAAGALLPEGTLLETLRADARSRNLLSADLWRPIQRLPLLLTGAREPSGEVLGLPGWTRPLAPWILGGLTLLAAGMARGWREASALRQALALFAGFHLAFLILVDPTNENLLALLFPFWGLLAGILARSPRVASAAILGLALGNYLLFIQPNRWPENNPHLQFVRQVEVWVGPQGLLVSRESLRTRYCRYALGTRLVLVQPGNAASLLQAGRRLRRAVAGGTRVVLDPSMHELADGWASPDPAGLTAFFRGTAWEPLAPGLPVLQMREPGPP